ncbi:multiple sugar transport system substrate-binding protein [Cohnella sp. OV330]|uniref:ABC transporter substrate-binding protein n=1 Tax=Cohnella sp. OV330 TaxID=1855288 RepID=UPI0008F1AFA8|nr:extracellular solute-binding protein [Cohnella sp. OV330]SFB36357.1 multiple sugar transport system substrate-binding protein [Cohnella sp. OV330]
MMKKINKSWGFALASLLVAVPALGACTDGPESNDEERRTLRIGMMYGSKESESYYRQQMTDMFEVDHGNIDIEFVYGIDYTDMQFATEEERKKQDIDPQAKFKELLTGDNPADVVMTDIVSMKKLSTENLLKPLDDYIKQDKMDLDDFLPAVIDTIKSQGNGQIYGLAPTFSSSALFYNKQLFADAKIAPPTDGMTWNEIFSLAQSLKSGKDKDAIYGFAFNNYGGGVSFYDVQASNGGASKMRIFDAAGEKMTVHTKAWADAWAKPIQLYKDKVIPHAEDVQASAAMASSDGSVAAYNPYQGNGFIGGKIAMTVGSYYMVNDLINYNKNVSRMKDAKAVDWDVVTAPQAEGGNSGGLYLGNLASINAKSANPDDAWAFIKHLNSEEVAKFKARSQGELSVRQKFIQPKDGATYRIEAFTNVKAYTDEVGEADQELFRERPNLNLISELGSYLFQEAADGKKTIDEALAEWDRKGNELLQKIKQNPKGDLSGELQTYRDAAQSGMKNLLRAAAGE